MSIINHTACSHATCQETENSRLNDDLVQNKCKSTIMFLKRKSKSY